MSDTVRTAAARAASAATGTADTARRFGGMHLLRQAIRMTARDWRAGELTMLLLALVLAVAALSSVGFLADRLHQGLERDARRMIAADFIVRADHPVDPQFAEKARALGLNTATTAIFPSMINSTGAQPASRLAAVKAVSPGYPLRGALRIASAPGAADHPAQSIPPPGTVWVDQALLDALKLRVGDTVKVGKRGFTIGALITRELDRGFSFVNFSPRLMLRADELQSTGLIAFGSRVTHRLLVAGADDAVARFAQFAHGRVDGGKMRGVALESLQDGQPQVRQTLDRAGHFLTLVSLLTALLAAVAIAMAAHRYMRRHLDGCAAMRCLGASQATLRALFTLEFVGIGLIGGALGVALGYLGHLALLTWLGSLIDVALPYPTAWPALQGIATGLVLLLGFALPPLLPLTRVPPVRVLRREWGEAGRTAWAAYALGIVLFAALLIVAAGELKLGGIVAGGFAGGLLVFACIARVALWGAARIVRSERVNAGIGWRYALASLERRSGASALQITALGIGLMCLLLIAMTRDDLVAGWRKSTPPDAPNEFIIDIQPDQREAVTQYLDTHGLPGTVLSPMVRGRLIAINGKPVNPDSFKTEDARRLVDREFNLSYTTELPDDNRLAAGTWYGDSTTPQISIEQGLAKVIDVKPGDVLRFDVTGLQIDAPVTSVRKLDWGSFKVNFFVLMPPVALQDFPATFITSFHLPRDKQSTIDGLIAAYPNLTAIDTAPILAQVQRVLQQVIGAVQFLFAFTLAAGVLVLYAALAGTRDERMRESALLRALGASHRQVRAVQVAEFVAVGTLAGLMAALGAQAIGWVLATRVFEFYLSFNPWLLPAGIVAGVACAGLGGWLSLRHVLARPALQSLRDA
ncbi:putative ABC transport system permease protein [Paraburkholderia terricola]|uniref:Putative ABC transport system permease protein n=2 Tax=Burkholderiaceae TaxID=119060 RepID=A0A1M6QF90_9BURK|nr:putative ABC transport system permease protein [Paraburkholderia terricola]SDO09953.1 putative ABC transport system permease protein [Paraburkholderia sediminicola]SHK18922.1 putative ABC transport system permease protein [Paraburkholderia terricola]